MKTVLAILLVQILISPCIAQVTPSSPATNAVQVSTASVASRLDTNTVAQIAKSRGGDEAATGWTVLVKDSAQILFWLTVATVSVLTYLGAKKTILQPIRTEIFKVQLEEMRRILSMFVGKGEIELRAGYAFDKLLMANSTMMFDAYAATFFDVEIDRDKRPYSSNACPSSLITQEGMMKHFELADGHLSDETAPPKKESKDPRVRAALWADYEQYELRIPKEFSDRERQLQDLLENPLLPSECVTLLNEYVRTVHENLNIVRQLLTKCAKQMPDKYPSLDALKRSSMNWIQHGFADDFVHLKPKADAIIAFVRSRYDVDNLLKG